jgi:hypothetical protein
LLLEQTGLSSEAELDSAMRRYELFCENLPDDAPFPTFMEFMNRPNAASVQQKEIQAKTSGRSFSSQQELEKLIEREMAERNAASLEVFEGLSPEQMHRLLHGSFDSISDVVRLRSRLPAELALEAPVIRGLRWILAYLADHSGEIKLTARENFPRAMCERFLRECVDWWKPGDPVPSESSIVELLRSHEIALSYGYVDEDGTRSWITTEGAQIYASGRWGSVFTDLIRFVLDELRWQDHLDDGWQHEHFDIIQEAAPFLLLLLHRHPVGTRREVFDRFAAAFPPFAEPWANDKESTQLLRSVFGMLGLGEFCEPFGLVRTSYEKRGEVRLEVRYETTPLFRETFEWLV